MTTTCLTVFLASTILAANAPVPAPVHAPPNNISPGGQPRNIPLTLIIDDPAPCINVYWWHVEERQKTGKPTAKSGEPIVRDVPVTFAAELAEVLRQRGIKGKFSVLPYPAGLGSIAQGLPGYSQADVERWLTIVRREIAPRMDITPEILTHTKALDLATHKLLSENEREWARHQTAETLTPYIAEALRILKRVGLPATGVTSPWDFGSKVEPEYQRAIMKAQQLVNGRRQSWYFLHQSGELPFQSKVVRREGDAWLVSIVAQCPDVFWQTMETRETGEAYIRSVADQLLTEDGQRGRAAELFRAGTPVVMLAHWQSLFSNGRKTGLRVLDEVGRRVQRVWGSRAHWVTCLELAQEIAAGSFAWQRAPDKPAASPAPAPDPPPWLGSKAGLGEEVLPPWTPVRASGGTAGVWGRSYKFGALPLPFSVIAREKELLASPIVLTGIAGGKEIAWTAGATGTKQCSPNAFVLTVGSDSEQLKCEGKARIEYDGMVRADLRLLPKAGKVTIERLDLEIPLRREHARYLHTWPGQWGSSRNSGALSADGYHGPLKPFVWLGDEWRGLAWFVESDYGFEAAPGADVLDIRPSGETVLMRVRLISKPTRINQPLEYTFGFQATPVKPLEPDAWDYRIVHMGNYGLEKQPYQHLASIRYPAKGQWDLRQGTFECWVRPRFDPQPIVKPDDPGRGAFNRNLLDVAFPGGRIGFYWNIDDRGMRVYFKKGEAYPLVFGSRADWRAGDWHHVAFTWGADVRVYLDGKKVAEQKFKGSIPGDLSAAEIVLGEPPCEMDIDEVRVSSVARERFDLGHAPEVDAQTLLLDHLDETFIPNGICTTAPAKGAGGVVSEGRFEAARFGRGLCLSRGKTVSVLDQLAMRGVRTICFHEHWTDIQNYTNTTREKDLKSLVAACHEHGIQLLLYFGYLMSDLAPEWNKYHDQCLVLPRTGDYQRQPKQTAFMVCYQSAWQDFLANGIDKMMERFGIDGVYLDGTSEPWACANTRHGCGYKRPDGSIAATYPFFATREMMRRIYTIVKRHNPKGQVNVHQSTCMTIPTLSFATSYWDGEQLQGLARRSNVFEVLPLDAFRTEFMGHNWGVPAELLWYSGGPFRRGEAEALALLHDIPVRPSGMDDLARLSRLWTAREEFGCHQAAWLPYWENEKYVRSSPAGVKVNLHNRPGQALLATIVNTGPKACQAELALDLKTLGQPEAVTAHNILTGKRLPLASGRLTISLGPLEYVILRLATKESSK